MHSIYNIIKVRKEREIREKIGFEWNPSFVMAFMAVMAVMVVMADI
jgi:hypothetical protein